MASESSEGDKPAKLERSGIAVSPGVGIGAAFVVDRQHLHVRKNTIAKADADQEVHHFRAAIKKTTEQLEHIKKRLPHGEHRQILKAQQLMLRDPDLSGRVEQLVREELIGAEWALARVTDEIRETLRQADSEYFRERSSDITFLAQRVTASLRGEDVGTIDPPAGSIVIAHELSPADTTDFARGEVVGIVTETGGLTSHAAIVARSMEIPAVSGVEGILDQVQTGDLIIVDAISGVVIVRPGPSELAHWNETRDRYDAFEDRVQREHGLPAIAKDGTHVTLRANISIDEELGSARFHGAEGVGLYRTEFLFMSREVPPTEEQHYRYAKKVVRKMQPYPVVFRTFDLGSDKPTKLVDFAAREANPALGLRSLRLALREREMFLDQLRGLLRAAVHGPLKIMLPLVSGMSELRQALAAVAEARAQLEASRMAYAQDVPVGIMIEMPSAAVVADVLAQHVDFMSIGTNDLIQYTLAIDRHNEHVTYLYRPLHPAILRLIRNVTKAGRDHGVPVSLCGEMAADPRYTWVLTGLGVRELSMHPSAVPVIKSIIRASDLEEMTQLAETCLEATDVADAERAVIATMRARFPEHLQHGGGQKLAVEIEEQS